MSRAYGTYAFLHGRIGAMKADLLNDGQWHQLLKVDSFAKQREVLQSTSYADWLEQTREGTLQSIRNVVYRMARKIERSVPAVAAQFIRVWARRDLLRNIKTILKGKALEKPEHEIRSELLELDLLQPLPVEALLRSPDLDAAFDRLESTPLNRWIREARHIFQRDPTLFGLDAALDRLYYPEVWQQVEQLRSVDRAAIEPLVRLEIDQVNLLWLLRYRLNYQLSPAETYYLLVPVSGNLRDDQLKQLVRQDSLTAVTALLESRTLREALSGCRSLWHVEVALWRRRAQQARETLRTATFTLGEALALLVLKVIEVRNLVVLFEGRALGVEREEIDRQLIGVLANEHSHEFLG